MALPIFMKSKEAGGASSSEAIQRKPDAEPEFDPMHSAAQDLIEAIKSGDVGSVASALRAAHEIAGSGSGAEDPQTGEA
jgi:hypothetical protein